MFRKPSNCFFEQKNGVVVREYIGYEHPEGKLLNVRSAELCLFLLPSLNSSYLR
jgi:hypothetical protein